MTQRGVELHLQHVSLMLLGKLRSATITRFEKEHGEVSPPTYETSVGEVFSHDADSISREDFATNEEIKAWKRYLELNQQLQGFVFAELARVYLCRGVLDLPEDDTWEQEQVAIGLSIPTDPLSKKVHWLETEVLVNEDEKLQLIMSIRTLSDPVEVQAATAADSFQR